MPVYINICKSCGKEFPVDSKSKNDPNNLRKYKRACSDVCTRRLKSENMKQLRDLDILKPQSPGHRVIDRGVLESLYCRNLLKISEISRQLSAKESTVSRELRRHGLARKFYRRCPQCDVEFSVPTRSMCNPQSSKFKRFCSKGCFLSSRKHSGTWIEREIETFLLSKGVSFLMQAEFGRMTVDFYIEEAHLVIEANGDFWHANPRVYGTSKPMHRYHERIIGKDERKVSALTSRGLRVHTVWEYDLKNNKERTLEELYKVVKHSTKGVA